MKRILIALVAVVGLSVSAGGCGDNCGELAKQICAGGLDCAGVTAWLEGRMAQTPPNQHGKACEMILASEHALAAYKREAARAMEPKEAPKP